MHEDQLLSLLVRFPELRERVEATLASELESFPALREDVPADLRGALSRTENRLIWYAWSEHGPGGPGDVPAWVATLDPALRAHAERLLTWIDHPPLSKASPRGDARERANGIALKLRQTVAQRRKEEMASLSRTVEDEATWTQVEKKLDLVLKYANAVTAPRKSTIFQDLGSRREDFG
jgi:hypothetical protein